MAIAQLSVDAFRQRLLQLNQQSDLYGFINLVGDYLALVPGDDNMRSAAVEVLTQKGLVSVAAEVAQAWPARSPHARKFRSLGQQLKRGPSDLVDWVTTDDRFAANLAALRGRDEHGRQLADELEQVWHEMVPRLTLHRANDGNVQVATTSSDGRRLWLPLAFDFAGDADALLRSLNWKGKMVEPILMDGAGSGLLIPRLHEASCCTLLNYRPAIYFCEENVRALALALRLHDWTQPLSDERVFLFVGDSAWQQWRGFMMANDHRPLPPQLRVLHRWPGQPASKGEKTSREVAAYFAGIHADWHTRARQLYAGRDTAYWSRRYASASSSDPLRVLCMTSRFSTFIQHSMHDACSALARHGFSTQLMIEEDKNYALFPRHAYLRAIVAFEPDLILLIDHHRSECAERLIYEVPFVCWIQDELPHLYHRDAGRQMGPLDFAMGYGMTQCVLEFGYPAERFMPCKLAVDPVKFARARNTTEVDSSLQCDVVYISHHSETPEELYARLRYEVGDTQTRRQMEVFYEQTRELLTSCRFNGGYDLDDLVDRVAKETGTTLWKGDHRKRMLSWFVRPLVDRSLRHTTLAWVADWADATGRTFHLYGNGWDRHSRFARYAKGRAEHGNHIAQIARNAAINLHTGINPALHQRVLETVCAGGFLLVRYHPHDFYSPGYDSLVDYVTTQGIDQPTQIRVQDLPDDAIVALREHAAATGGVLPDTIEISAKFLLELKSRHGTDKRYHHAGSAFPRFAEVTFDSAEAFAARAERLLTRPDERDAIRCEMQQAVSELFSYDVLMPEMIAFVGESLRKAQEATT